jgi:hypothetical protein
VCVYVAGCEWYEKYNAVVSSLYIYACVSKLLYNNCEIRN